MSNFWNSCFDDLMSTAFRRDKDRSDSKSKFQVIKLSGFMQQTLSYNSVLKAAFSTFSYRWSGVCVCLCEIRKWSWTPAWSESGLRTTGTSAGRSRAPASRGWCGSTGKLFAGFWPVREEHGPTGMITSDFYFEISLTKKWILKVNAHHQWPPRSLLLEVL